MSDSDRIANLLVQQIQNEMTASSQPRWTIDVAGHPAPPEPLSRRSGKAARDGYVEAVITRLRADRVERSTKLAPGVYGTLPSNQSDVGRLLIVDDRAEPYLHVIGGRLRQSAIAVLADAPRCVAQLNKLELRAQDLTAMVCNDIATVPALTLPRGLMVHAVQRVPTDPPGIPLYAAARACAAADADVISAASLATTLRTQASTTTRLFAAVDDEGNIRATSGSFVTARQAGVFFVSTDRDWRGRGVGTAMTGLAIDAAKRSGGQRVCLEATILGVPIYLRLGFASAGAIRVYSPESR